MFEPRPVPGVGRTPVKDRGLATRESVKAKMIARCAKLVDANRALLLSRIRGSSISSDGNRLDADDDDDEENCIPHPSYAAKVASALHSIIEDAMRAPSAAPASSHALAPSRSSAMADEPIPTPVFTGFGFPAVLSRTAAAESKSLGPDSDDDATAAASVMGDSHVAAPKSRPKSWFKDWYLRRAEAEIERTSGHASARSSPNRGPSFTGGPAAPHMGDGPSIAAPFVSFAAADARAAADAAWAAEMAELSCGDYIDILVAMGETLGTGDCTSAASTDADRAAQGQELRALLESECAAAASEVSAEAARFQPWARPQHHQQQHEQQQPVHLDEDDAAAEAAAAAAEAEAAVCSSLLDSSLSNAAVECPYCRVGVLAPRGYTVPDAVAAGAATAAAAAAEGQPGGYLLWFGCDSCRNCLALSGPAPVTSSAAAAGAGVLLCGCPAHAHPACVADTVSCAAVAAGDGPAADAAAVAALCACPVVAFAAARLGEVLSAVFAAHYQHNACSYAPQFAPIPAPATAAAPARAPSTPGPWGRPAAEAGLCACCVACGFDTGAIACTL